MDSAQCRACEVVLSTCAVGTSCTAVPCDDSSPRESRALSPAPIALLSSNSRTYRGLHPFPSFFMAQIICTIFLLHVWLQERNRVMRSPTSHLRIAPVWQRQLPPSHDTRLRSAKPPHVALRSLSLRVAMDWPMDWRWFPSSIGTNVEFAGLFRFCDVALVMGQLSLLSVTVSLSRKQEKQCQNRG